MEKNVDDIRRDIEMELGAAERLYKYVEEGLQYLTGDEEDDETGKENHTNEEDTLMHHNAPTQQPLRWGGSTSFVDPSAPYNTNTNNKMFDVVKHRQQQAPSPPKKQILHHQHMETSWIPTTVGHTNININNNNNNKTSRNTLPSSIGKRPVTQEVLHALNKCRDRTTLWHRPLNTGHRMETSYMFLPCSNAGDMTSSSSCVHHHSTSEGAFHFQPFGDPQHKKSSVVNFRTGASTAITHPSRNNDTHSNNFFVQPSSSSVQGKGGQGYGVRNQQGVMQSAVVVGNDLFASHHGGVDTTVSSISTEGTYVWS
eukprot:PhF_6_TR4984/c0_g1_i2/m.7058